MSTGLIYAIEEPETSQHPHNQVMLVNALEELAEHEECQVFLSTHTPVLARRFNHDVLRLVTNDAAGPVIHDGSEESTIKEIVESLGVLPDHNVKAFFGVEGKHDISFLKNNFKKTPRQQTRLFPISALKKKLGDWSLFLLEVAASIYGFLD